MCGFLGEISNALSDEKRFRELLGLSFKRGPDQQHVWKNEKCQLGFNRLAILDISEAGKQPMISPSGRFVMVFNGEIYNYKSLKITYELEDTALRSTSDAEILVHLLDKMSLVKLASKLNGMFAIAVWDTQLEQLTLIRDFAGIKPLYYGAQSGDIVFASQFDQIFKHPLFTHKTLRPDAMKSYFGLGYMHGADTVFENIFQVLPGQLIVWDYKIKQVVVKKNYYHWYISPELPDTDAKTKEIFKEYMEQVVKHQLQSDVPLATFLSSGFDSSLVTAFAKQEHPFIKAFTFGLDNDGKFDERKDAKSYADILKVDHITDTAREEELLGIIDDHFKAMPEPFGDYSSIPTYVISQKARQFATVMLSGDGGDELFWGYPRFRTSLKHAHWFRYPLWIRKTIFPLLRKSGLKLPWGIQIYKTFSEWILSKQLHFSDLDQFMPQSGLTYSVYDTYKYDEEFRKEDILQYLKKNEFYGHMQRILKKVDLTSMAHSLEVRVPFLDREMIAFSNRVQSGFTIHHDKTKLLLKNSLYDFIPKHIVNTEKKGFSVPMKSWLRNKLKADFTETVLERPFYGAEAVDMVYLEHLISEFFKGSQTIDVCGLWHVYAWQKWAIHHDLI
jgi:asparagine synthase (glutamine-hydrolysing)